ncbi:MAG TPA: alpha/beta fold hydrolase [Acidobacteriota bacterium]|nr:alpha/beta fold hydrolase [Acidobacteriota bacterium]
MAKKSQTVKDIVQVVVFLLVVGILLTGLVIYPLNRTKVVMGRDNIGDFNPDSLAVNDAEPFLAAGLRVDTFHVEADGLTKLACVYLTGGAFTGDSVRGTVILLHDERTDRTAGLPLASSLVDSGFAVMTFDLRASGLSGGKYHGDGQLEASDLEEIIAYLDIRDRAVRPICAVGWSLGGDAALLAALEEERIDRVVAVNPYLTTGRMIDVYRSERNMLWLPFFRSIFWWWYEIRSSYAVPYRKLDDIRPAASISLVLADAQFLEDRTYERLIELSSPEKLRVIPLPDDESAATDLIVQFLTQ